MSSDVLHALSTDRNLFLHQFVFAWMHLAKSTWLVLVVGDWIFGCFVGWMMLVLADCCWLLSLAGSLDVSLVVCGCVGC